MPRPKGSKNKKTLEREAAEAVNQKTASPVSQPETEASLPKAKMPKVEKATTKVEPKVVKSEPLPDIEANAEYIIKVCDRIYQNLHQQQKTKWERGVGKNSPHFVSAAHAMAATLISYFDLGIAKEETLQFYLKQK